MAVPFPMTVRLGEHNLDSNFLIRFIDEAVQNLHMMCHIPTEPIPLEHTVLRDNSIVPEGEGQLD